MFLRAMCYGVEKQTSWTGECIACEDVHDMGAMEWFLAADKFVRHKNGLCAMHCLICDGTYCSSSARHEATCGLLCPCQTNIGLALWEHDFVQEKKRNCFQMILWKLVSTRLLNNESHCGLALMCAPSLGVKTGDGWSAPH